MSSINEYIDSRTNQKSVILYNEMLKIYLESDFSELRNPRIFQLKQFTDLGWNTLTVMRYFKGNEKYLKELCKFENQLYIREEN